MTQEMYVDHHIQAQILDALVRTDATFSELKPDSTENSLFMYHTRKLLQRGIVEKYEDGYRLTREGASWCNRTDNRYHINEGPRNLVQFLVIVDDNVLVSRRKGALTDKLNEYMLPGGLHALGKSSREAADECAEWLGLVADEKLTTCEMILPGRRIHTIVGIYRAHFIEDGAFYEDELYESTLMPLSEAMDLSWANGSISSIVRKYLTGKLDTYELIKGE